MSQPRTTHHGESLTPVDVAIVGGGLAGLTAGALVARGGRSVAIFESASHLGGRAATNVVDGVYFNLGAHALYAKGDAARILRTLGLSLPGRFPSPGRPQVLTERAAFRLPAGLVTLLTSRLLGWREKMVLARLLGSFSQGNSRGLETTSAADWIADTAGSGPLASLLAALFRVSTYCADQKSLSASAALDQLRLALTGNVIYLDRGWQTLIDGLAQIIRSSTTEDATQVVTGHRVDAVVTHGDGVEVVLADGRSQLARVAILATPPDRVCALLQLANDTALARWVERRIPVQAACLDVALRALPRPHDRFALGLDRPLYYSVHSAAARLGPDGVTVLHVMKYLPTASHEPPEQIEAELATFLDRLQPGWSTQVLARRFLPRMTVTHALPRADAGGLAGRPPCGVAERPRVLIAGDWVGSAGMLADASAASAEEAAHAALAWCREGDRSATIPREGSLHVGR